MLHNVASAAAVLLGHTASVLPDQWDAVTNLPGGAVQYEYEPNNRLKVVLTVYPDGSRTVTVHMLAG